MRSPRPIADADRPASHPTLDPTRGSGLPAGLAAHLPWLLVLSVFPLMAMTAAYHVPLALMAIFGTVQLGREPRRFRGDPGARLILALFLALWIPQLTALPAAAAPLASLQAAARYVIFYPLAALFILGAMRERGRFERLALGVAAVVGVWSVDHALGPAGMDLLGGRDPDLPYWGGLLFDVHTIATVAAVASPVLFELVRRRRRDAPWVWLCLALLTLLVLLSGRRVAWMMFALAGFAYAAYRGLSAGRVHWRLLAAPAALIVAAFGLLFALHGPTRDRVDVTLGLFSADRQEVDLGTSYRLDIWTTSVAIARAHWPLGAGAIGTRHVYAEHAAPDDFWIRHGFTSPLHPHQFVLEVAAETGLAGLLGYLLALLALALALARTREPWAWASGIALGVALFPLNAHVSFYASYWSMMIWWLVGLTAAGLVPDHRN